MKPIVYPAVVVLALAVLAGCGGSSGGADEDSPDTPSAEPGMLRKVASEAELKALLEDIFTTTSAESNQVALSPGFDASASTGFTGTYTQEARVDEFDAVRYDGSHLYVAPQRFFHCCFIADALTAPQIQPPSKGEIRILETDPATATTAEVGAIALEEGVSVQGMYLDEGRLFALTSEAFYGGYGDFWGEVAIWAPETMGFRIYDTSDPAAPRLTAEATIDGVFVDSRRIGDTVYIISRHAPILPTLEYPVLSAEQASRNQQVLDGVDVDALLPKITLDGDARPLIEPPDCYIGSGTAARGFPVITTITAVPISDPASAVSTCYDEQAYGVHVSAQAIYLTQLTFDSALGANRTRIHKFRLGAGAPEYAGSAEIGGQVWTGGQADFRLSEHDGLLRVFASEFGRDRADSIDHKLYLLREAASGQALEVVSELPNAARPEEIGKPNESLYGVRFLAERAYAVTFLQIDPLVVIDLADSSDPRIAGELEVSGFSDFLHPVSDDLLLGLGVADTGGIKLELFDISDISDPRSRGSEVLGGPGSYSEARFDRHAFTYLADVGGVDRFAIPADLFALDGISGLVSSGLRLFEIRGKASPASAALVAVGALEPPATGPGATAFRNRAFLHDDAVFYVRDEDVWGANWAAPENFSGPH